MDAYVVSLVLEALLLGTFTVTYTMGAYSLLKSLTFRTHRMRDWVLLSTSTAMFGLAFAVRLFIWRYTTGLTFLLRSTWR